MKPMTEASKVAIVTGGAGFIGSHMVDLLRGEGVTVRIIDNLTGGRRANIEHLDDDPEVTFHELDIRDTSSCRKIMVGASYVFHFAGIGDLVPSIDKPLDYMSVNVQGTASILEAVRGNPLDRFIYAASSTCYGLAQTPTREDHPICPEHPYALSKNLGEQTVLHWSKVYGLPINSVRIFNAFGLRSRTTGAYGAVIGVFIRQMLAGKPLTIVGDGSQRRDFLNVKDVVRGFWSVATKGRPGEVYNLAAGNPQSVNRLAELIGGETVYIPKRPGEPDETHADISKIQSDTGWTPRMTFEEGVAEILARKEYWADAPLWDVDSIAQATDNWFKMLDKDRAST